MPGEDVEEVVSCALVRLRGGANAHRDRLSQEEEVQVIAATRSSDHIVQIPGPLHLWVYAGMPGLTRHGGKKRFLFACQSNIPSLSLEKSQERWSTYAQPHGSLHNTADISVGGFYQHFDILYAANISFHHYTCSAGPLEVSDHILGCGLL